MGGRVGVVDPDRDLDVALDRGGVRRGAGDEQHRADALRVERERLGERRRDEQLRARPDQLQQARGVLAQAVAEALVGKVHERQHPSLLDEVTDPAPQLRRRVHAGRVVAGAVEQDDVARRRLAEGTEHRGLVDPAAGRVRVRVRADLEAGREEQLRVVGPGGLAHPERLTGAGLAEQVRRDAQAAGPARGLGGQGPAGRHRLVVRPEDQVPDEVAVGLLAVDGAVELGPRGRGQAALGLDDGAEHGRPAGLVHEDARGQVDLALAGVVPERLGQAEDRIGRGGDAGERRQRHGTGPRRWTEWDATTTLHARPGCGPVAGPRGPMSDRARRAEPAISPAASGASGPRAPRRRTGTPTSPRSRPAPRPGPGPHSRDAGTSRRPSR